MVGMTSELSALKFFVYFSAAAVLLNDFYFSIQKKKSFYYSKTAQKSFSNSKTP
uniref:Uncharacterized protein n=1 Tax=Rhizophora mucronata TaxID=61149 RepID=A0A2P2P108_RHIMU